MVSPKVTAFKTLLAPKWLALTCFLLITAINAREKLSDEAKLHHLIKKHAVPLTHKPHFDTSHSPWREPLVKTPPLTRIEQPTYKVATPVTLPSPLLIMARQRQSAFYPKKVLLLEEHFPQALFIRRALTLPNKVKQGIEVNPISVSCYTHIKASFPSSIKYLPHPLLLCEPTSTFQKLTQKLSQPMVPALFTPLSITPVWKTLSLKKTPLIPHRAPRLSLPMHDIAELKVVARQPLPRLHAQPHLCGLYQLNLMPLTLTVNHGNYTPFLAKTQQTAFPCLVHDVFPKPSYQDYLYYKVAPLFETGHVSLPYKVAFVKAPKEKRVFRYASLQQVNTLEILTPQASSEVSEPHTPTSEALHLKGTQVTFMCALPASPKSMEPLHLGASRATFIGMQSSMTSDKVVVSHKLYPPLDDLEVTPLRGSTPSAKALLDPNATWADITLPSSYHTWEVFPTFYVASLPSPNTEADASKTMIALCSSPNFENTKYAFLETAKASPLPITDQILVETHYRHTPVLPDILAHSEISHFPVSGITPTAFIQIPTGFLPDLNYGAMALSYRHLPSVKAAVTLTASVLQQAPYFCPNTIHTHQPPQTLTQAVLPSSEKEPLQYTSNGSISYLTQAPSGSVPYALPTLVASALTRVATTSSKLDISSYDAYHELVLPKLKGANPTEDLVLAFIPGDETSSLEQASPVVESPSFVPPYLAHDRTLISEEVAFYTEFIDGASALPQRSITCSLTMGALPFEEPAMPPTTHTLIFTEAREPIKAHTTYLSPVANTAPFTLANTHSQNLIKAYGEGMLAELDLPESLFLVYENDVHLSRKHHHTMYNQRQAVMLQLEKELDYEVVTLDDHYNCDVNYAYNEEEDLYDFEILLSPKPKRHYPQVSQNFIFVVDNSALVNKQRYAGFKKGIVTSLNYLKPNDTAAVIVVDKEIFSVTKKPLLLTPTAKKNLAAQINAVAYSGYYPKFDLADMMRAAQTQFAANKENVVVLLSDAHMFADIKTTHRFMKQFAEKSRDTFAIYTAACKSQHNLSNMRIISELHQGTLCYSPTVAAFPRNLAILVKHATSTISSNIDISLEDGESANTTLYPSMLSSTLFNDEPFKLYGSTDQLENFSIDIKAHGKHALISLPLYIDFDRAYLSNHLLPEEIEEQKAISSLHQSYFNDDPHFFQSVENIVELNEASSTLVLQ